VGLWGVEEGAWGGVRVRCLGRFFFFFVEGGGGGVFWFWGGGALLGGGLCLL